ncbi:MAG: carboxypeptidase-like regulatory domain-containing protein, partial [Ginsengibacter sp.]
MQKIFIVFSYCFFLSAYCFSQNKITGKIVDQKTGEPVESAILSIGATGKASATDAEGRFNFNMPGDSAAVTISMIGYRSKTIELTRQ